MFVGVGGICTLGIQDGHGRRQLNIGHVVIADDEVDAVLLGIGNLGVRLDAAVEHDNQSHASLTSVVNALITDAIALFVAVRDVEIDVGGKPLEKTIDEGHSRAAIDIVVTIYQDAFLAPQCLIQPIHCHAHIAEEERIQELTDGWAEEMSCLRSCHHTTV